MPSSTSKNAVTSIIRRASNLLTQRTTSFTVPATTTSLLKNKCPPLDGEIIFSKNNICVHPPSRLHSYTLHHPGYLCVKCQNSPQFGSTLILTWIPNSTLKNRSNTSQLSPTSDENSSPSMNTNPEQPPTSTPRHSLSRTIDSGYHASNSNNPLLSPIEQEENENRRHSSDDQYEDALDDKSYMRQASITSDLTEGPDEILDEQDVDDAFETSETADLSPNRAIDDSLPFMKETNLWKNASGICEQNCSINEDDEAVRTVAEQFCGVFSVDLGKMRSLRLFYCDDLPAAASGSGQLVIASCESQYKVLHFHNGGLDRLIEILNEWNLFAYEKTRRGFANCH
ncbi:unnamed protein product, partial [Adineta ricciae]